MSTTNKRSANTSRGNSNKSSRLNNDAEGEPRREERLRQSPPAEPSPVFLPQPLAGLAREAGEAFFNRPTVLERLTVSPGVEPLSRRGRGAEDLFRTQLEEWSRAPVGHDFLRLAYEQANNQLDLAATEELQDLQAAAYDEKWAELHLEACRVFLRDIYLAGYAKVKSAMSLLSEGLQALRFYSPFPNTPVSTTPNTPIAKSRDHVGGL